MMSPPVIIPQPVERLWPNSTVVILGTGPSLTKADVDFCRGKARVIAVNDAHVMAPWADVLYAADASWWRRQGGVPSFPGLKFSILPNLNQHHVTQEFKGVRLMGNTGAHGLELDPSALRTGFNSGYQAIGLSYHLGATTILLLGFDMHGDHFFGSHPDGTKPVFELCLGAFQTLVEPLKAAGVSVLNCTPGSALTAFPMASLRDVLEVAA